MSKYFVFLSFLFLALLNWVPSGFCSYPSEIQLLTHRGQAFASVMDNIRSSKKSVDMMYFIWDPCSSAGRLIISSLTDKVAKDHIKVRLLIDSLTHDEKMRDQFTAAMKIRNIDVKYFSIPRYLIDPQQNIRNHAKFTLVDDNSLISGGGNISDDYFGMKKELDWMDKDVLVQGGLAPKQAMITFETFWTSRLANSTEPKPIGELKLDDFEKSCLKVRPEDSAVLPKLPQLLLDLGKKYPKSTCDKVNFYVDNLDFNPEQIRVIPFQDPITGFLQFIRNNNLDIPQHIYERKVTTYHIVETLKKAKKSVVIENFSYAPTGRLQTALWRLYDENIPTHIFTTGGADSGKLSDNSLLSATLDRNGNTFKVTLMPLTYFSQEDWFFKDPKVRPLVATHSKAFVIDDTAIVSSFNIDPRSYMINYESAVVMECPTLADQLRQEILQKEKWILEMGEKGKSTLTGDGPFGIAPSVFIRDQM